MEPTTKVKFNDLVQFCRENCTKQWPSDNVRDMYLSLAAGSQSEDLGAMVQLACTWYDRDVRAEAAERALEIRAVARGLWLAPDGSWRKGTRRNNVVVPRKEI